MAGLTARVVADLDVTLKEFHSNVVIISIIQKDAIVLCSGHLKETQTKMRQSRFLFGFIYILYLKWLLAEHLGV